MGWSGADLPVISDRWADLWSVADAAWLLDIPAREVREVLRRNCVEAVGKRYDRGRGTRHVRVYAASDVLEALDLGGDALAEVLYGP